MLDIHYVADLRGAAAACKCTRDLPEKGRSICGRAASGHRHLARRSEVMCLQGTLHLVDAAKQAGVKKFVLMSSLLTNGREAGQGTNPNFIVLNLFGGVLDEKLKVIM